MHYMPYKEYYCCKYIFSQSSFPCIQLTKHMSNYTINMNLDLQANHSEFQICTVLYTVTYIRVTCQVSINVLI